ncbi:hypothetical protein AC578_5228 [Lecanosticta acicola]|uniref:Septin-type G domain-containing protein n=1 Tax=Lecanosticta acicola TaxID=111012 RepID=A0AAI8YRL3_9PEZI|nr:hypothetical protein AC578_5228 [Lecanosticta acicola]
MAAGFRDSERIGLGSDTDFTISHRKPPPVPNSPPLSSTSSTPASPPLPHIGEAFTTDARVAQQQQQQQQQLLDRQQQQAHQEQQQARVVNRGAHLGDSEEPTSTASQPAAAGTITPSGGKRRGSFSFLRRSASNSSATSKHSEPTVYHADSDAPPLPDFQPRTRIAQASADAASRRERQKLRKASTDSERKASFTMLRKSSRLKKQEQEEAERQAKAVPRQPPHLPSLTFVSDDVRPDSVAIFNNSYTHSISSQPRTTANFSRPAAMGPSSNMNSSSSPAYATRSGSGLAGSSSPPARANGEYVVDPTSHRTESMTNRSRYSYASSVGQTVNVNSPRRVRRRKDPTPFNVLVIGAKGSGKTSFISFLRHSLALPAHKQPNGREPQPQVAGNRSSFTSQYLETEMDGERMGLTLWDSVGLEKNIVDLQLREMTAFVEAKFEDTFVEEQKVMRSPGVKDTHIHCVFLVLDPVRLDSTINESTAFHKNGSHAGSLDDDLDLQVLRALWGKTTVIPVISKADTLTVSHMAFLKRAVWSALKGAKLDPLEALELEDDEDDEDEDEDGEDLDGEQEDTFEGDSLLVSKKKKAHNRHSSLSLVNGYIADDETPYLPMSIISPDIYDLPPFAPKSKSGKQGKVGRKFPWGFADPYDPEHCDFGRLRDSIFSEWRDELRGLSRTKWYENWRTSRLRNLPGSRQRIKGGVTPVAAVPKEGRMGSQSSRQFSPTTSHAVPRSFSAMSSATASTHAQAANVGVALAVAGKSSRDVSGSSQTGSVIKHPQ